MNFLKRDDEFFMNVALAEARKAFEKDEVPVGAVIVLNEKIIAKAHNQVELLHDATAHAEMLVITQASAALKNWRLSEATIYVTKEPCPMCAGAMINSRIKKLVYGLSDPQGGAAGSALSITNHKGLLHTVEVVSEVLPNESLELLQSFFKKKRVQNN
ncbi:MAG: tRNA adenosine(34) deaminase TadA [Verrucomicrobiota bacterium]|nr:tRNA adenosine(34) deaminase TadA [Verrucomicrobiota bacterium]